MRTIGFMRNFRSPSYLSKLIATLAESYGIKIIYLRPRDINIEEGTVNGKILVQNKWITTTTKLPKFIDISPFCYKKKNEEITDYLNKYTTLSYTNVKNINKFELQRLLQKDPDFEQLVIPTKVIESPDDVMVFLDKYGKLILKPVYGQFGSDVYTLSRNEDKYVLLHERSESVLSHNECIDFLKDLIEKQKFLVQKYIKSVTKQGYPFDCRINVEKNGRGEWTIARMFFRIGIGQKVVSNISQGGGVSNVKPFLESNFKENAETISNELKKVAMSLPYKIEELRESTLMTLGIDIGLDSDGKLYLFEVNSAPGTTQLKGEAALLRVQYYNYMLSNL